VKNWWDDAVGYEVYLRSFADGDDDGIGDFAGISSKLDHLSELGIDIIWVTPFYPSPLADSVTTSPTIAPSTRYTDRSAVGSLKRVPDCGCLLAQV
jgi:glycosidase